MSRGYINWNPIPNALKYRVEIYHSNDKGIDQLTKSYSSSNTFQKLDANIFTNGNESYKIIALNGNGIVIGEGGPWRVGPSYFSYFEQTKKSCNNPTSAWSMTLLQKFNNYTDPLNVDANFNQYTDGYWYAGYPPFTIGQASLTQVGAGYGVSSPLTYAHLYRPMSFAEFTTWKNGGATINAFASADGTFTMARVYKGIGGNLYDYKIIPAPTPPADQYFSIDGAVITGQVYLVEKKMEEYAIHANRFSGEFLATVNDGDASLVTLNHLTAGWSSYYNNTTASNAFNLAFPSPLPITSPAQSLQLQCLNAGSGSATPTPVNGSQSILAFIESACWFEGTDCPGTANSPGGFVNEVQDAAPATLMPNGTSVMSNLEHLVFRRIDGGNGTGQIFEGPAKINRNAPFVAQPVSLVSGLYDVTLDFGGVDVYHVITHYDASNATIINNASFASLLVYPNQIQNDVVNFKVTSQRKMKYQIQLISLDGTILYNHRNTMIFEDQENTHKIPVSYTNFPYNQIKVRITFADGSFTEQTAVR